jgi:hypothetical protein
MLTGRPCTQMLPASLQARKDADQGRLSRAILAEQDMNLTGKDVECDIVVRDNSGKPLGDAAQFDGGAAVDGYRRRRAA